MYTNNNTTNNNMISASHDMDLTDIEDGEVAVGENAGDGVGAEACAGATELFCKSCRS